MKTFGDRLRNAREKKNFTQIAVAKKTGINNKTISNYENNISSPDPETLKVFTEVYETSADYLIGRTVSEDDKETIPESSILRIDISGLPEEAVRQIEDYAEFIKQRYSNVGTQTKK